MKSCILHYGDGDLWGLGDHEIGRVFGFSGRVVVVGDKTLVFRQKLITWSGGKQPIHPWGIHNLWLIGWSEKKILNLSVFTPKVWNSCLIFSNFDLHDFISPPWILAGWLVGQQRTGLSLTFVSCTFSVLRYQKRNHISCMQILSSPIWCQK